MFRCRRDPQVVGALGEVEGGQRAGHDDRGDRVREEVRTRPLAQQVDHLAVGCDVPAGCATERLAQRAGDDVDAVLDPEQLRRAAATRADEAHGVGVVDEDHRAVRLGEVADPVQRRIRAVHREDPVGDDHDATGAGGRLELGGEVGHVGVAVAQPPSPAQPDPVDERRVVQLVGHDGVLGTEEGLEDPAVGVEARRVEDRRGQSQEVGETALELGMRDLGPADEPHRRQAEAPLLQRRRGRRHDLRVVGEPEVVVGAEVQRRAVPRRHVGRLGGGQLTLVLPEAGVRGSPGGFARGRHASPCPW